MRPNVFGCLLAMRFSLCANFGGRRKVSRRQWTGGQDDEVILCRRLASASHEALSSDVALLPLLVEATGSMSENSRITGVEGNREHLQKCKRGFPSIRSRSSSIP